nr:BTAD domain-containing putative transcriptional regulator [Kribbella italica]
MEIRLLGPFEVLRDGVPVTLPGRQLVALTSLLALSANRPVPFEVLADRLWGERLPQSVKATLHTYATRLRKHLGEDALRTSPAGYSLTVAPAQVDALQLAAVLGEAGRESDPAGQRVLLTTAIDLWRDLPFAGSPSDWLATGEASRLTELYLSAVEQRLDLDLADGRYDGLPAVLQGLTARHPLRESLWQRRIAVLRSSGRPAEALECYEQIRSTVAAELGVDPSPALQQEFARLLEADSSGPSDGFEENAVPGVPRQLPADLRQFTGRANEQLQLMKLLGNAPADQPTIITLTGPGGAGKTGLAVHWAHQVRDRCPDGQLFADLRGFAADEPVPPAAVLHGFLQALGVPANGIPTDQAGRAALFRTVTADKRLLLLLDNARNAEQVSDLIPASGCLVLITSRNQLRSLAARLGAERITLEPLPPADAVSLLAAAVGAERVAAEPEAVQELTSICAGLPLALAVAAESARRTSGSPFADLVGALQEHTLDVLAVPDDDHSDLRRVLSWSYQALASDAARLFRLLGLHPATTIRTQAAAALADLDRRTTTRHLDRLVAANLLSVVRPGHYRLHDLLRVYAAELTLQHDSGDERRAALERALDWLLHSLQNAQVLLGSDASRSFLARSEHSLTFDRQRDAVQWVLAEQSSFVPWMLAAVEAGDDSHGWRIAWRLRRLLDVAYLRELAVETARIGVEAAERLGDPRPRYLAWNTLAGAHHWMGMAEESEQCVRRAIEIAREHGDVGAEVAFTGNLAALHWRAGRLDTALTEITGAIAAGAGRPRSPDEPLPFSAAALPFTLGGIHVSLGNHELARDPIATAIAFARADQDWHKEVLGLCNLAELHERQDDDTAADFYAGEALDRLQAYLDPSATVAALAVRTRVAARAGRVADARELGDRAFALLPADDRRLVELRAVLDEL